MSRIWFYPAGWPLPGDELHGKVEDAVDQEVDQDECEDVGGGVVQHVSAILWNINIIAKMKRSRLDCTWGKAEPEVEDLSNVEGSCEEDEHQTHLW